MTRRRPHRVERRDLYARVPDAGSFRVNYPDGFLHDFMPIAWSDDASRPGSWWLGQDTDHYAGTAVPWQPGSHGPIGPGGPAWGPRRDTFGSPLTEPARPPLAGGAGAGLLLPAVTRCLNIIVDAVVRTRWLYTDRDGQVAPRPLWVDDPMLLGRAPGPIGSDTPYGARMGAHQFWSTLLADAILWGQGGFIFAEESDGTPKPGTLQLLNPFLFRLDDTGHVVFNRGVDNVDEVRTDFDGRFIMGGQVWRAVRMPGLYPEHHGWPQGVLLRHFGTFGIGARLGAYLADMYDTGIPSGYLSVSTPNWGDQDVPDPDRPGHTVPEQELLKRRWMQSHGGSRRSVAVLNSLVSYTPLAMSIVDSDAVKMASANRVDIAHAFGMSSVWLDEGMNGLNYSNSSERRADLVTMTLAGWGERLTDVISSLMPYGTRASVLWPMFISPSIETLTPSLVQLVGAGIYTGGEARQYLGMQAWSGPDPDYVDTSKGNTGRIENP